MSSGCQTSRRIIDLGAAFVMVVVMVMVGVTVLVLQAVVVTLPVIMEAACCASQPNAYSKTLALIKIESHWRRTGFQSNRCARNTHAGTP